MTFSQSRTRHRSMWAALAVVLVLPACSAGSGDAKTPGRTASPSPSLQLSLSPKAGATRVAPASRVTLAAAHGTLAAVAVVASSGDAVTGRLAAGGTRWQSRGKLAFGVRYTVTATTPDGRKVSAGSFRTAARPDLAHSVYTSSVLGDHKTYGVGMPIILRVGRAMESDAARSAFERTLSVRSRPATAGAWGWVNSREVHFRPRNFWAAGSKVHVSVDSAGRALGGGRWGRTDLTVDFSIGARREMRADGATHTVTVIENGKTVRTMPASLGKPSFPSSSGVMVIMDKRAKALFDSSTYGLPVDSPSGYRISVPYATRISPDGIYLHEREATVWAQGNTNVSAGCLNLSAENARWFYEFSQPGDVVEIRNTAGQPLELWQNGDWSVPWQEWLQGSALRA